MLKAKDIMSKEVVSISKDAPVKEALELMLGNAISGMPVVEEDMRLVGIVTEKDLLVLFYGSEGGSEKTVEDFMTKPAVYFEEDESLEEICKCLLKVTFRRVPVTRKGKVVGIVSRPDVLRCVCEVFKNRGQKTEVRRQN